MTTKAGAGRSGQRRHLRDPRRRPAGDARQTTRGIAGMALLLFATGVAGCGSDSSTAPTSFDLVFHVETIGVNVDTDGYTLTLNRGNPIPLPPNGETTVPDIPFATQEYEIGGLAPNCRLVAQSPTGTLQLSLDDSTYQIAVLCLTEDPGSIVYTQPGVQLRRRSAFGGNLELFPFEATSVAATLDGTRLAFSQADDIWIVGRDGVDARNVTNTIGILEERPDWSPEGDRIVYEYTDIGGTGTQDVHIMTVDGLDTINLTPGTGESNETEPAWSGDGSRIVFRSDRSDASGLYTITPEGRELTRLTDGVLDVNPRWSPDGGRIVFGRYLDPDSGGTGFELFTVASDGTGLTQLTDNADYNTTDADWSPDGQWMVIASRILSGSGVYDLYSMSPDGRDIVRLTFLEQAGLPRWTP